MKKLLAEIRCQYDEKPFYVMNDYAQWYCGLKYGKANFTDDFNEARTLDRDAQFKMLKRVSD